MSDITILLADDRATLRRGLHRLLDDQPGLRVVGEADDGWEAVKLTEKLAPDVVIMDLHMPRMNGVEATRAIAGGRPQTRVLLLSIERQDGAALEAMRAGAWGCVWREAPSSELLEAIRAVHSGQVGTTAVMTSRLLAEYCRSTSKAPEHSTRELTPRDERFLACLIEGASNREIAGRLRLSEQTVKNTLSLLYKKLLVENRSEAVAAYRRLADTSLAS